MTAAAVIGFILKALAVILGLLAGYWILAGIFWFFVILCILFIVYKICR